MSVKSSNALSLWPKAVLAIDCALGGCVAAVRPSMSGNVFERVLITEREQAAKLIPIVQDVMNEANVQFADLGLIVTTVGPGSFTGLRIGLSAVRSMGLALDIPVQGVSTLKAMMLSCKKKDGQNYLVVLDSKRSDFYVAAYDAALNVLISPCCMSADDIIKLARGNDYSLCGDASQKLRSYIGDEGIGLFKNVQDRSTPCAKSLIDAGHLEYLNVGHVTILPQPIYMRGADVSLSLKPQRSMAV